VQYQTPEDSVRQTVQGFGDVLKNVPLSGTTEIASLAIKENYRDYLAPNVLDQWVRNPNQAIGRLTSSPWPERIDIESITRNDDGTYTVEGEIVYMTSEEMAHGGDAGYETVTVTVEQLDSRWFITYATVTR
jgi:hypothetical protein